VTHLGTERQHDDYMLHMGDDIYMYSGIFQIRVSRVSSSINNYICPI